MVAKWQLFNQKLWFSVPVITAGAFIYFTSTVLAQVKPDQTLGKESSVVTPVSPKIDRIDGGAVRGSNLFHSFKDFNVGEGRRVNFANPAGIDNILSRVTGGNASNILGTLGVLGNANLYLLNPNGIIFGPNARLDIRGSFVASTSKGITFEDRILYGANNFEYKPLLTMAVPVGLQYGTQGGNISNAGNLKVGQGHKLALMGNTVTTSGKLTAPGGTVHVLGERVGLLDNAQIDVSGETAGGNVLIGGDFQGKGEVPNAKRTFVGSNVSINADALTSGDGGRVIVWADETTGFYGNISARGGSQFGDGGFAEVSGKENLAFHGKVDVSASNGNLGTLLLDPENIRIISADSESDDVRLPNILFETDPGETHTISNTVLEQQNGDVVLEASNNITVDDGLSLNFSSSGGSIKLTADADNNGSGNFEMDSGQSISTNGRDIEILGASLELGNIDTSSSFGDGGNVILKANNDGITTGFIRTAPDNSNKVGDVTIESRSGSVEIREVNNQSSKDSVFARSVTINNSGKLSVIGDINVRSDSLDSESNITIGNQIVPSSINVGVLTTRNLGNSVGSGGKISIKTTGLLDVTSASDRNGNKINFNEPINNAFSIGSEARGDGGKINISADGGINTVAGIVSNSRNTGNGGEITLTSNNGAINIQAGTVDSSSNNGDGGIINLTAAVNITTGSILSNSSGNGKGGDITLSSSNGTIDTSVGILNASSDFGIGNGGNVTLDAKNGNIFSGSIESIGSQGGSIKLNSGNDISIEKHDILSVTTGDTGKGGGIDLIGKNIELTNARVANFTTGEQESGNINLKASEQVSLLNNGESARSVSGSVLFNGLQKEATFKGGTGIATTTTPLKNLLENIGSVPEFLAIISSNSTETTGKAGDINVTTKKLRIEAKVDSDVLTGISTASLRGKSGNAGNIEVNASESLDIIGNEKDNDFKATPVDLEKSRDIQDILTGITSATMGEGDAGSIIINPNSMEAGKLKIEDGAAITSSSSETAEGNGGAIAINASSIELNNKAAVATATVGLGQGNTGSLTINVPKGNIELGDGALIGSDSTRSENAGGLDITASNIYLGSHSRIGAAIYSEEGQGGDITIKVANDIKFKGRDSEVSSEATFPEGATDAGGGNLRIEVGRFIRSSGVPNNNDIVVTADGRGVGGKLDAQAKYGAYGFVNFNKFRTPDSDFSAASRLGEDGTLSLITNNPQPQLPQQPNVREIVQVCPSSQGVTTRAAGKSEYINTGHGGLPPNPNEALESNTAQVPWVTLNSEENQTTSAASSTLTNTSTPKVIREAQGWMKIPNGKLLLTTQNSNSSSLSCVFQTRQP